MDRIVVTGPDIVQWIEREIGFSLGLAVGMGVRSGRGTILGAVAFNEWNGVSVSMHGASVTPHWLTRGFIWLVFWYAFHQLGAQRIGTAHGEGNKRASRLVRHLGFSLETTLERAHPDGRLLIYRLFVEDCRFLKWRQFDERKAA